MRPLPTYLRILCALFLLALSLSAAQPLTFPTLTTTKGITYRDVTVTRFDAIELRFRHANGAATVPLADLPPELQSTFGYDPRKAAEAMSGKHEDRVQSIISEADKKAKAAAQLDQEAADAAELKAIQASALRCHVSRVNLTEDALLLSVLPADKLPLKIRSRNGKSERVKLTPQGKPELVEQIVPGQTFALGETLRILPRNTFVTAESFITVYLIGSDAGPHPLCALTPEVTFKYRRKLAALKAAEQAAPPPAPTAPPAQTPAPAPAQ